MPNLDIDRLIRGWRGPLLAALVALIAGLPGMLAVPPIDRDESRFAQATAQMLETDNYVDIRFQDQPRYKKPVGIHWLQALSVSAFSDAEAREIWAYRLPSLLGVMAAAAACAWGAGAFFGSRGAVLAGITYGSSVLLTTEAHFAKTDAVLAALVTLAMAALGRIYLSSRGGPPTGRLTRLVFWLALAGSVLIKGPVGPMIVAVTLLGLAFGGRFVDFVVKLTRPLFRRAAPAAASDTPRESNAWMKQLGWVWGLLLVALVVGPWAIAITVASDGAFWGKAISSDLTPKLTGGQERHGGPFGYHLLGLPLWFYPGSLMLAAAAVTGWTRRHEPGIKFALCWLIPAFLVFELAPTKLPHYPLPLYGALAWLVAAALEQPLGPRSRQVGVALGVLAATLVSALAIVALRKWGDAGDVVWVSLTVGFAVVGTAVACYFLLNRAALTALVVSCVFGILAHAALAAGEAPNLKPIWPSRSLAKALKVNHLDPRDGMTAGPVEIAGYSEPSAVFLLGTDTGLGNGVDAAEAIGQNRPAVVERREEKAFHAALMARGLHAEAVAVVKGYNTAKGRSVFLTIYRNPSAPLGRTAP